MTLPIGDGPLLLLAQTGAGFLLTVLLFSSSAATALILTAIHSGLIDLSSAAAMVIGANLGTSVKAFLAAIGATANAKRAAAAHILFNTITAVVAFLILPALVTVTTALTAWSGAERDPAIAIALFHTLFNVLGVVLIWPLANPMAAWLQRHFRTREEDEAQPRYLDHTLVTIPDLALSALQHELVRLRDMASAILERAIVGTVPDPTAVHAVRTLTHAIARFIAAMNQGTLTPQLIDTSERLLRVARYYESAARFAEEGAHAWGEYDERDPSVMAAWERFRTAALALLPTARNAPTMQPLWGNPTTTRWKRPTKTSKRRSLPPEAVVHSPSPQWTRNCAQQARSTVVCNNYAKASRAHPHPSHRKKRHIPDPAAHVLDFARFCLLCLI
ncbi:Na/Pi cotransporter family protein [Hydrogenophilus thermoluteolus]|uniref:Na/Pi cotransporter family protein n=1 Tax=Hydrogenophilus thermoluteolus TaxID=297 RepID=UPI003F66809A